MNTREAILSYYDYEENWENVRSLLAEVGTPALLREVAAILDSGESDAVPEACMFIRDLATRAPEDIRALVRQELDASPLTAALERAIIAGKIWSSECITAVVRLGLKQCLPTLYEAFDLFYCSNPLLLLSLVWEINCLGGDDWSLYDRMAASDSYLTRWALLYILSCRYYGSQKEARRAERYISALAKDPNALVKQEATYRLAKVSYAIPVIDFSLMSHCFYQYLSIQNKDHYTLQELEQFVAEMTAAQNK